MSKLCGVVADNVLKIQNKANVILNMVKFKFDSAKTKVRRGEHKLQTSEKKCNRTRQRFERKKQSCQRSSTKSRILADSLGRWRRRQRGDLRARIKRKKAALKKTLRRLKREVVGVACMKAADLFGRIVSVVCKAPLKATQVVLTAAQWFLTGALKILRRIQNLLNKAVGAVGDLLRFLQRVVLKKVAFSVEGLTAMELKGSIEIIKNGMIHISAQPNRWSKTKPIDHASVPCSAKCPAVLQHESTPLSIQLRPKEAGSQDCNVYVYNNASEATLDVALYNNVQRLVNSHTVRQFTRLIC